MPLPCRRTTRPIKMASVQPQSSPQRLGGHDVLANKDAPCSGGLYSGYDQYGACVYCLQCELARDVVSNLGEPLRLGAEPQVAVPPVQDEGKKRRRISHGGRHFARTFASGQDARTRSAA